MTPEHLHVLDAADGHSVRTVEMVWHKRDSGDWRVRQVSVTPDPNHGVIAAAWLRTVGTPQEDSYVETLVQRVPLGSNASGEIYESGAAKFKYGMNFSATPFVRDERSQTVFVHKGYWGGEPPFSVSAVSFENPGGPSEKWELLLDEQESYAWRLGQTQLHAASTSRLFLFGEADRSHWLAAVRKTDGTKLWSKSGFIQEIPFSNVERVDSALDPMGRPIVAYGNSLIAFGENGDVRWSWDADGRRDMTLTTVAAGAEGRVYAASLSDDYAIRGFDASGAPLFTHTLPGDWTYPQI
jgi:hypothetical protein